MAGKSGKKRRLSELMVLLCLAGLLVSVAVPFSLRHRRDALLERGVASAAWHSEELARWLDGTVTASPGSASFAVRVAPANREDGRNAADLGSRLREYVDHYSARMGDHASPGARLSLEAPGTAPDACRRDGRIHLVPMANRQGEVCGASIVATNSRHAGGPRDDGILVLYSVSTAKKEPAAARWQGR